jgi:hypothetical protein
LQAVAGAVPELRAAVAAFESLPNDAGASVTDYLRAYDFSREAVVRLLLSSGRVLGYYALAAASVRLPRSDHEEHGLRYRRQPAILIGQLGRAIDAPPETGRQLVLHAAATARRVSADVGATVLVLDPFDEETSNLWRGRYGFREADELVHARSRLHRLWTWLPES